jgi:GntR family transcriptional regulator
MLIVVDQNSGVPVYRQIMDQVRFQVAAGVARAGDELPSTRTLSQQLGVNPMTISKAYALLEAEGVVTRRPGLPLVVSERTAAVEAAAKAAQLKALLEPAAAAVHQLELDEEQAVTMFRQVLDEAKRGETQAR